MNIHIDRKETTRMSRIAGLLADAERKLDEWGRGAWIAAMVLGFIVFWPLGLLLLGYMIWSGRMGCSAKRTRWHRGPWSRSTGNSAFDDYREQTLRRLEEEQGAFEEFLGRLRKAKDKAEFDQFMEDRRRGTSNGNGGNGGNGNAGNADLQPAG
jgi:hypothetical protein